MVDLYQLTEEYKIKRDGLLKQLAQADEEYSNALKENKANEDQGFIDYFYWETDLKLNLIESKNKKPIYTRVSKSYESSFVCEICGKEHKYIRNSRSQIKPTLSKECLRTDIEKSRAERIERETKKQDEIKRLRSMPYKEYLQSEHWQTFRKQVLRYHKNRCQLCNSDNKQLQVHHRTYENRGNEEYKDVIVLCLDCHSKFHDKI